MRSSKKQAKKTGSLVTSRSTELSSPSVMALHAVLDFSIIITTVQHREKETGFAIECVLVDN